MPEAAQLPERKPYRSPARVEQPERPEAEDMFNFVIEELLVKNAQKINEGNNGVIFRVDMGAMSADLAEGLAALGLDDVDGRVIKLLKIYVQGQGKVEYDLQLEAYNSLRRSGKTTAAQIPKPYLYRDLRLSPESQQQLKDSGLNTAIHDKIEVLIMDYVPGTDLATILYREALQRSLPEIYPSIKDLEAMDWATAKRELEGRLDFRTPGGKSGNPGERALEMHRVESENAEKLLKFLRKTGFVLHPAVLSQLQETLQILHQGQIAHRDLHERNIMVDGDYHYSANAAPQVHLIDFGAAVKFAGQYSAGREDIYSVDNTGKRPHDEAVLRRYEELCETPEMKKARIITENSRAVHRRLEDLGKDDQFALVRSRWLEYFAKNPDNSQAMSSMYIKIMGGKSNQDTVYRFLGVAQAAVAAGFLTEKEVKSFLLKKGLTTYQNGVVQDWHVT